MLARASRDKKSTRVSEPQEARAFLSQGRAVTVGHTLRETELLEHIVGGFSFHCDSIGALNRIVLLPLLIKSNLADYPSL